MDETTDAPENQPAAEEASVTGLVAAPTSAPNWLEQDPLLRELWAQQLQPDEIAAQLNRSTAAVMTRAARLGLPRRFAPGRKAGQKYAKDPAARRATESARREREVAALPKAMAPVERICLMCLKKFPSEGRFNRICPSCKGSPEYAAGTRIPDINFGSDN